MIVAVAVVVRERFTDISLLTYEPEKCSSSLPQEAVSEMILEHFSRLPGDIDICFMFCKFRVVPEALRQDECVLFYC